MSERVDNPAPGDLPPKAARMLAHVFEKQRKAGESDEVAASSAWCTVERHYVRGKGGRWRKRRKALDPVGARKCPSPSQAKRRRKRNAELTDAELRLLDELGTSGLRSGKPGKAWDKVVAKHRTLIDAQLVDEGPASMGTRHELRITTAGRRARSDAHESRKAKRTSNPHPSLAQLGTMSEHGRVHELQVERADGQVESHTWSGAHRPLLLWSPRQHALVFVHGVKVPRPTVGDVPRDDGAAATFERFFGKRTMASREFTLPAVDLRELGRGILVAYWTPLKWRKRVAEHKLGPRVRVWMGSAGGRKVYAVAGGNLRMTARGIEG
jgi:hypothetical protein